MIIWATALPVPMPPQEVERRLQLLLEDDQLLKHSSGRRPHFHGTLVQPGVFLLIPKRWLLIKNQLVLQENSDTTVIDIYSYINWPFKYLIGIAIGFMLLGLIFDPKTNNNIVVLVLICGSVLLFAAMGITYMIKNILADALLEKNKK